jgi:hypothetical protein
VNLCSTSGCVQYATLGSDACYWCDKQRAGLGDGRVYRLRAGPRGGWPQRYHSSPGDRAIREIERGVAVRAVSEEGQLGGVFFLGKQQRGLSKEGVQ